MRKKFFTMLIMVVTVLSLVACGDDGASKDDETKETNEVATDDVADTEADDKEEEAGKSYTIGYAPATLNNAFWLAVKDGVVAAIEEKGIEVNLVDVDANGDQAIMNDRISDLLSSGIDALLIAPADSTACTAALNAAHGAGVPIINFDTPVDADDLVETIIASDNYNAGYVVGKDASEKIEDGAKILVLHSPRASACVERYDGFIDALDESGKDYTVVNVLDGEGDQETSMRLATDAIVADPDLSVIFAVNDPSAMGAVNAIQQSSVDLDREILVYGVDGNPDAKKMIKDGAMEGTGSQSPETLGYKSMMSAFTVLEGGSLDKNIVVDTFLITADNVDEFGTDGWQ